MIPRDERGSDVKGGGSDKVPPVSRYVSSYVAAVRRRSFRRVSCSRLDIENIDEARSLFLTQPSFFLLRLVFSSRLITARGILFLKTTQLPDTRRGISSSRDASTVTGTTNSISFYGSCHQPRLLLCQMIYNRERNEEINPVSKINFSVLKLLRKNNQKIDIAERKKNSRRIYKSHILMERCL